MHITIYKKLAQNPSENIHMLPVDNQTSSDKKYITPAELGRSFGRSYPSGDAQINGVHLQVGNFDKLYVGDMFIGGSVKTPLVVEAGLALGDGTAANPSLPFANDPSTGIYRSATGTMSFSSGGTQVLSITPTGISMPAGSSTISADGNLVLSPTGAVDFNNRPLINVGGLTVQVGLPNQVVINDGAGTLTSEQYLSPTRGGTGTNSTAATGVAKVSAGTWSFAPIINTDIQAGAAIARSKLASGTANHVVINDGTGVLTSEQYLSSARGGTGTNSTAATGVAKVSAGIWSFAPLSSADIGTLTSLSVGSLVANTITTGTTTLGLYSPVVIVGSGSTAAGVQTLLSGTSGAATTTYSAAVTTTTNTPTSILTIATTVGNAYAIKVTTAAVSGTSSAIYDFKVKVKNTGSLIVGPKLASLVSADAPLASAGMTATASSQNLVISVVGTGATVKWSAKIVVVVVAV